MNIWLITVGEPLKTKNERLYKTGILSKMIVNKGHHVTWWTSTFDHQSKSYIFNNDKNVSDEDNLEMIYLHSKIHYTKNISIKRIINHRLVAKKFNKVSSVKSIPDLIYCSFPTIELSFSAVKYAKRKNIPIVVDTRDLWPDIFFNPFPKISHPIIKILLYSYLKQTRYVFRNANAITAVSKKYLTWSLNYSNREKTKKDKVFPLAYTRDEKNYNLNNYSVDINIKGLDSSKIIVWFVGSFGQTYDLQTVINGAKILAKQNVKNVQFVLSGDGDNMKKWSALASDLNNVIFTGWVGKKEINYLSSTANIGIMAYSKGAPQGLPNKIFEYMAAGMPILSSLQGETESFLEKHKIGLSYEPGNAQDFVNKLDSLIENETLMKELGNKGKVLFESNYTSDIVYNNLIEYLKNFKNEYTKRF